MTVIVPFIITLGLICSGSASAENIYRWVDKKGKVHFSDRPTDKEARPVSIVEPPEVNANAQNSAGNKNSSSTELHERTLDAYRERRELKQQQQQEQSQLQKQELAKRQNKCEQARNYLSGSQGRPVYHLDKNGKRIYLSEEQIKAERDRVKAEINKYCD